MKIAACLLTCDRPDLTARTVASFVEHNRDRSDLVLLHADGGSQTDQNCQIAQAAGFRTLVAPAPADRIGQLATLRVFLETVLLFAIPWVLWLENDWESVAPVPRVENFPAYCLTLRLFGTHKFRAGPRALAGPHRIGTRERITWRPIPSRPDWEWGYAHWGAGGTIIRTPTLAKQATNAKRLKDVITANPYLPSARTKTNVMWSIGEQSTPGFIG